jgi:hypothetical protein
MKNLSNGSLNNLLADARAIQDEDAKEAGSLGFMARILVQVTFPHSNPHSDVFERKNGNLSLAITSHPGLGVPYGVYPRLLLAWLSTEAVTTKEPTLELGASLSAFMRKLGILSKSGGQWGNVPRLREQMGRLFASTISIADKSAAHPTPLGGFKIASRTLWEPTQPKKAGSWESTVTLSHEFFYELINRPVPVDIRALRALKSSSMALDLYCWLTYRLSYLERPTEIPWELLRYQFGAGYANDNKGRNSFKIKLLNQLTKVGVVYESARRIKPGDKGLILVPGKSHIKKADKKTSGLVVV